VQESEVQSKLAGEEIHDRHGTEHQCLLRTPPLRQVGLSNGDCVFHARDLCLPFGRSLGYLRWMREMEVLKYEYAPIETIGAEPTPEMRNLLHHMRMSSGSGSSSASR